MSLWRRAWLGHWSRFSEPWQGHHGDAMDNQVAAGRNDELDIHGWLLFCVSTI
jgi:hypothetical protein